MNHLKTFVLLAAMTALFMGIGHLVGGTSGMMIALLVAIGLNFFSYWNADKIVLRMYRARPASEFGGNAVVRNFAADTEALARNANLPVPRIFVIENDQPNAFATGRDPNNAAVAATTGLLRMLSREEIRGVMAHELAHVKNRDTLTMTITATIAGAIGMLANFAMFFSPRDSEGRSNPIAGILVMLLAPIAASLVQMTISRAREYEADRIGAEISGDPLALASALAKIDRFARGGAVNYEAEQNPATAHMFIINPLSGQGADNLFSTHPATANRIAQLKLIADKMGSGSAGPLVSGGPSRPNDVVNNPGAWGPRPKGPWG